MFTPDQQEQLEGILKRQLEQLRDDHNLQAHKLENVLIMGLLNEQRKTNEKLEALIIELQHRSL